MIKKIRIRPIVTNNANQIFLFFKFYLKNYMGACKIGCSNSPCKIGVKDF